MLRRKPKPTAEIPESSPQDQYYQRMREKGLVKVAVWVPEHTRDALTDYAEQLRNNPKAKGPS